MNINEFTNDLEQFLTDDMSILGDLLKAVRGISPISMVPDFVLDAESE